ncbi:hypothetical protein P0O24_08190 [Methanotrichaceae archaeon M04Ac]|uniref:Uncharacterized protein n=1 Tax=Candidatus Methanocrinis alkalitolerans TaxID=3033395 RepID=A0ABT5XFR8_9EURY|nr:hypothetical protein [Candidatus Methanocrinis alkalitolerans]MDF0593559.1 hypothetical protein [Candidatus Methanocrinis alkalitolerans]
MAGFGRPRGEVRVEDPGPWSRSHRGILRVEAPGAGYDPAFSGS